MAFKVSLTKCVLYAGDRWALDPQEVILIGSDPKSSAFYAVEGSQYTLSGHAACYPDSLPVFYGNLATFKCLTKIAFSQLNLSEGPPV